MRLSNLVLGIVIMMLGMPVMALEGKEIMRKVLQAFYYQGHDQRTLANMEIVDNQGRTRIREFISLRMNVDDDPGKQKYYMYFNKPADVKKMVFMVWKNVARDDDRWLYLPALDLVKRIAASDDRTSFVGSNFFYEDVSGRGLDEDTHQLSGETERYYIIESFPRTPETVEFTRYEVWVDKKTFLPMKIDYYSGNAVYRTYKTMETQTIDGYETVTKAKMKDKRTRGSTIISYSKVKYLQHIPDNVFTERYLRRPPKKYLR